MVDRLALIALMALVARGAWVSMGEGMILQPLHRWVMSHVPWEFLRKPIATCPYCMVSVWGGMAALSVLLLPWYLHLPFYVLAACGLQPLLDARN